MRFYCSQNKYQVTFIFCCFCLFVEVLILLTYLFFCQATEADDKAESMGTLKQLQKLVRTKKNNTQSLEDVKHVLIPLSK